MESKCRMYIFVSGVFILCLTDIKDNKHVTPHVYFTGNSRASLALVIISNTTATHSWTLSELMQDETPRLAQTISLIHLLQQAGCVPLFIYRSFINKHLHYVLIYSVHVFVFVILHFPGSFISSPGSNSHNVTLHVKRVRGLGG